MRSLRKTTKLLVTASRKIILHPADGWLSCRLAWYVAVISVSARLCPLPTALRLVSPGRPNGHRAFDLKAQERLAAALDRILSTNIFVFRPLCWKRAAVLHRFLTANGVVTRICFGVRTEADGKVAGHAWLESEGKPILEREFPNYVITYTFPSDQEFSIQSTAFSQ
jgi:hypothetical protein